MLKYFGLFALTITKHEIICIYKHFSKYKNFKTAFGTAKEAPTFLGAKCNIWFHSERDITKRFERFIEGSNPSGNNSNN